MSRTAWMLPLVLLVLVVFAGCGGDDAVAPPIDDGNAPHPDNATVAGRVVKADNPNPTQPAEGLSRAVVTEPTTGRSVETDSTGAFILTGLPASNNLLINASVPRSGDYDSARLYVQTMRNQVTRVEIAVLPVALGTPTALAIGPENVSVESGATVQYTATVAFGARIVNVQPSWTLLNDPVGAFQYGGRPGRFVTTQPGVGRIRGTLGDLVAETVLTVLGSRPPDISSVFASNSVDRPVAATGGNVTVTAAVSDGDGVRHVFLDVFPQHAAPQDPIAGTLVAGAVDDGTWRMVFAAPANSNQPNAQGVQAPQMYSMRVRALDADLPAPGTLTAAELAQWYRDHQTTSDWLDFAVSGLEAPPPPSG